jgi:hypothetical protein
VLNKIAEERDSFKKAEGTPTTENCRLLDRLDKACTAYNQWRLELRRKPRCAGAVKWAAVTVPQLLTYIKQPPDMKDPIFIGVPREAARGIKRQRDAAVAAAARLRKW